MRSLLVWCSLAAAIAPAVGLAQSSVEPAVEPASEPRLITARLGTAITWRSQCARPGVRSCAEYDRMDSTLQPLGQTVDFSSSVPYLGVAAQVELLPFARSARSARSASLVRGLLRGLGLSAAVHLAALDSTVQVSSPVNATQAKKVTATDLGLSIDAVERWYFPFLGGALAYAGVRAGFGAELFSVPAEGAPLLGSHRAFPELGAEVALPFSRWVTLEASGGAAIAARPRADERAPFGASVSSSGFWIGGGVSGQITGLFGYAAGVRWLHFADRSSGAGERWTNGGAAEESFLTVFAGATARY